MKLEVKRYSFNDKTTLGKMYVDDSFFCYTLEDKYREIPGTPVESWKIPKETAIPVGTYKVILDYSAHFNRDLPKLLDVPGYEGVRIHPGNDADDTEGCILVGGTVVNQDYIANSRATFGNLYDLLDHAYEKGEEITITIGNV